MRKPDWLAALVLQSFAIVASILLALWVDQWKQQRAEHELATIAVSNFLREIEQNKARIDDILPYHQGVHSMLAGLETSHAIRTRPEFQGAVGIDGLRPPSLLQTAWQTAVATGALTHLDYETVSALSLTYTLQDRFREDSRTGLAALRQASNFGPGGAENAIVAADNYTREVVAGEEDLRATYEQAEDVLKKKLHRLDDQPAVDTTGASRATRPAPGGTGATTAAQ